MKDLEYIERITKYSKKIMLYMKEIKSFEEFHMNEEKVDAVIFNLEQIGESAKKLSNEIKEKCTNIHWPKIIGLRNMISHEYEGIKMNIIYDIATHSIPELLNKISKNT